MSNLDVANSHLPRSVVEINDPYFVQSAISRARNVQYGNVALATVLIYHSVITFDKEVKHFWTKPCSSISIVFLANRCVGLLGAICSIVYSTLTDNSKNCSLLGWITNLAGLTTVILIDYILVIRVLALYHQDRKLSIFLNVLLGLEAGVGLGLYIYYIHRIDPSMVILLERVTICAAIHDLPVNLYIITWTFQMTFALLLLVLALYKSVEYWRMSNTFKGFRLVRVLLQDHLLYFVLLLFSCIAEIVALVIFDHYPVVAFILAAVWSPTLYCVFGGQLLINLKEEGERGVNGGTNNTLQSVSNIEFACSDDVPALQVDGDVESAT